MILDYTKEDEGLESLASLTDKVVQVLVPVFTTLQKKIRCFNLFKGVNLIETEANIVNVKTTNFYQRSI